MTGEMVIGNPDPGSKNFLLYNHGNSAGSR